MEADGRKLEGRWIDGSTLPALPRMEFDEFIARLLERKNNFARYQVLDEIGRGGMGRVLRVIDVDMHRELAMKVLRQGDAALFDPATPSDSLQLHARFLEEAQIAGQLDHPGIVPVHDVGLDSDGRVYFTMKLVRGQTLHEVIKRVRAGDETWTVMRALNVVLRVCEAMSYAHERGVLHRDLKPGNIMVGTHGEVFVMDWGLARVLGRRDGHMLSGESESSILRTARRGSPESEAFSAFLTEDGRVLGTPAYMSPEQGSGDGSTVTAASDVYSVGAILYHLLSGVAPYATTPDDQGDNRATWLKQQTGPPRRLGELAKDVAPELIAICEKAMERDVALRYPSMSELSEDIRAYLEVRVVRAYRSGPLAELRKWIGRNRTAAGLVTALVIVVAGSGFFGAWRERVRAEGMSLRADAHTAASLIKRESELWPVAPAQAEKMKAWTLEARAFVEASSDREVELQHATRIALETSRARVVPVEPDRVLEAEIANAEKLARDFSTLLAASFSPEQRPPAPGPELDHWSEGREILPPEAAWWQQRAQELRAARLPTEMLNFTQADESEAFSTLETLVRNRSKIAALLPSIEARAERAGTVYDETITNLSGVWREAIDSIADRTRCPLYNGLIIRPQVGLVPLRRDPTSGLWEFWHVLTGERPELGPDDRYRIRAETGIVLILLPGGLATAGAQSESPDAPRYDASAGPTEKLRSATLHPFFVSKYELTQGQWCRMAGDVPSTYYAGYSLIESKRITRSHPVENVSWYRADEILRRFEFALPSELQWESAARAGTSLPYGLSAAFSSIEREISFADAAYGRWVKKEGGPTVEDGSRVHLPVDSFAPNGFGLHCVLGNVAELCRDAYADSGTTHQLEPGTGEDKGARPEKRSARGGSYKSDPLKLRLSARAFEIPDRGSESVGIRPVRMLEPQ